jgi:hypothetical protein
MRRFKMEIRRKCLEVVIRQRRITMFRSIAILALLLMLFCLPVASQQGEQYTALVLPAPTGAPGGETRALALNNSGQVFGIAGVVNFAPPSYVPGVWTGGVFSILPTPTGSGYQFNAFAGPGYDFINDSGTVVSLAINDAVVAQHPNFGRRPIVWNNGTPIILPLPSDQGCAAWAEANPESTGWRDPQFTLDWLNSFPVGLNAQGHILVNACGAFWIWNSGTFQLLVSQEDIDPSPTYTLISPIVTPSGNHLNNMDHAVLDAFVPGAPIGSPPLFVPAIYSFGSNTLLAITGQPNLASHTINNSGQVLFFFPDVATGQLHLELWDGTQVVDLGLGGAASLNNRGEVVFSTPFPFSSRIYKNGVISPLNVPAPLSGRFLFNDAGQIAANTSLTVSQPYAVLFTPIAPPTPTPTLGNYLDTYVPLSGDTAITPDAAPTNTTSMNVSTSTNFKGKLEADPNTGSVRVTDAHPAGTYTVTVKAFSGSNGPTTTKTFTLTVTTPPTCNPVSFATATFEVGDRVGAVLVGDFNGDGKQDLAVTAIATNWSVRTLILLGDGAGQFNFFSEVPIGARAVADFNGDGKQDLVALDSSNAVIYLGDGTGQFSAANSVDTGCAAPFQLAIGDFNGDGRLDLAFACYFSNTVTTVLGIGAGGFGTPASFSVSDGPQGLAVGDFNGDGKQDLAVACQPAGMVSILLGNGAGGFAAATNYNGGATPRDIEVGDFNGDGKQDLAVSNPSANAASVLLGDGAGGFGAPASFSVGTNPTTVIAVGDFNGDGKQDLAVPNFGSSNVSILLGNGVGSFGPAVNFGVGLSPFGVAVGDFNGDGMQDLATPNWDSNNVTILLRDCAPAETHINNVISSINNSALPEGTKTSLGAKLNAAVVALQAGDIATACIKLQDFLNELRAQRGKKIPEGFADALANSVMEIRTGLGCI